ncbi:branched-chain amino acid ABC transporter, putative [Babesia ovis]|uniref:Branched-chain amino acid ABC transporter, putative n=1 Tax=Babesia ovis TaxID=5869 RepID=A0A9W5T9S0_BABOV|nr:branched-chain amino acid ABC transporter, putative [Babesia ovis]
MDAQESTITTEAMKRPAEAAANNGEMETTLPRPCTLKSQYGKRVYTIPETIADPKVEETILDDQDRVTKNQVTEEIVIEQSNVTLYTLNTENDDGNEVLEVGVQKDDLEPERDLSDQDAVTSSSTDLIQTPTVLEGVSPDILSCLDAICDKLEYISQTIQRLENAQNTVIRRVNRKNIYNQFLIE